MGDVNVQFLIVTHSILCLVVWQSSAHSANHSNATGKCLVRLWVKSGSAGCGSETGKKREKSGRSPAFYQVMT